MEIRSADVIHSWWVPELGRKIDAIPGRINNGWIRADTVGEYEGTCSEYCGTQHAWMRIRVIAEDPDHFSEWLRDQKQPAQSPTDSLSKVGQQLFQQKTCGNCHSIRGTPANEHLAPDLTHLASRETLLAGMKRNNDQNLKKWISDPQKVKKGAHMPDFLFSDQEVNALTSYLEQLK
jgi:cytochrome c oxidase subunit 2